MKNNTPKYPTGHEIRLDGPTGNTLFILATCRQIGRQLGLSKEEMAEFDNDTRLDGSKTYKDILDACVRWFGIEFIKDPDE